MGKFNSSLPIFILDDDQDDLYIISSVLKETCSNQEVYTADNFEVLNKMLEKVNTPPKAILLDLNMPLISGKECLYKLRANKKTAEYPVIIFSTTISEKDKSECKELGVNKFLVKPHCIEDLKKIAAEICLSEYPAENTKNQMVDQTPQPK